MEASNRFIKLSKKKKNNPTLDDGAEAKTNISVGSGPGRSPGRWASVSPDSG